MNKRLLFIAAILLFCCGSGFCQENMKLTTSYKGNLANHDSRTAVKNAPWFVRKYEARLGAFMPFSNTNVSAGNDKGTIGTDIDFENDLGFRTYTFSAYTAFIWHISRRSELSLSYFYINRSATHTLEKDIRFRDTVFYTSSSVASLFATHIGRIAYSYAILSKPSYEAGFIIGAHIVNFNTKLALNSNIGQIDYSTRLKLTAPLPDIGIFGGWAFNDKLALKGSVSYFTATISNINLHILNYNILVLYQPVPYLGFSLSYTGINFRLNIDDDPLNGYLKWGYHGPVATVTYRFGKGF